MDCMEMDQRRERVGRSQVSDIKFDEIDSFIRNFFDQDDGQERPNMIFSVIGDSNYLVPKVWPKSRLQVSLTYAARAAGESWILSQGEPTKISKIVREMVEEYVYLENPSPKSPIRLVSIPSKKVDDETLYFDLPEKYEDDKTNEKFLLSLEGGIDLSEMDYITYRLQFEKTLCRSGQTEKNAVVIVLVEGDLSAVEHVKLAVENGIPVVVIQGTGGAADLLAELITAEKDDYWQVLLPVLFGINLGESEAKELSTSLQYIRTKANLIIRGYNPYEIIKVDVFDLQNKDEEQFAATVGELIHRTWSLERSANENQIQEYKHRDTTQTDYTKSAYCKSVNWNRDEILWHNAKNLQDSWISSFTSPFSLPLDFFFRFSKYIKSRENQMKNPALIEKIDETLLCLALISNRTDYIETLLDLNVSLSEENINELYKLSISRKEKMERSTLNTKRQSKKDDESILRWVMTDIGGKNATAMLNGKDAHANARKIIRNILYYTETEDPRLEAACHSNRRRAYIKRQLSLQAILLWSLFFNKVDISTMIWKRVANQLYTGLVSTVILKKISDAARLKDTQFADELADHSNIFKKRVCIMMDTLYQKDKEDTFKILDSFETVWKIHAKPIFFAYEFELHDVIAHPCSVAWMNQKWYNGLIPNWKRFIGSVKDHPKDVVTALSFHFVLHYILFAMVLLMYSYFLLTPLQTFAETSKLKLLFEITLYVWTALDFLQDIMNVLGAWVCNREEETRRRSGPKLLFQLNDMWKALGLLCFILAVASFFSRMKKTETFTLARRFCALLLIFSYLRCSRVFAIHKFTGSSFMFLRYMLVHLFQFLSVIIFMIIGVGIFYQALLNDNETVNTFSGKWYKWRVWYVLYYPYYQLYGEPFPDELGFGHTDEQKDIDWSVTFVAAIYMLVAHLLVISLITAMFTTKYEKVLQKSEKMWQYERFHIISDFRDRMFEPLNILSSPVKWYWHRRKQQESKPCKKCWISI